MDGRRGEQGSGIDQAQPVGGGEGGDVGEGLDEGHPVARLHQLVGRRERVVLVDFGPTGQDLVGQREQIGAHSRSPLSDWVWTTATYRF